MRILLLRHGEPRRGGDEDPRADYGLTEVGQRQINTVAENMTDRIDRLVASHLPRAQESADIVARHLGIARVVTEPMIGEIDEQQGPDIESLPSFLDRVGRAMALLAQADPGTTTLAVTHAGFIMGSVRSLFDIPTPGTGARLEPRFASITEWRNSEDIWELVRFNVDRD